MRTDGAGGEWALWEVCAETWGRACGACDSVMISRAERNIGMEVEEEVAR